MLVLLSLPLGHIKKGFLFSANEIKKGVGLTIVILLLKALECPLNENTVKPTPSGADITDHCSPFNVNFPDSQ